MPKTVGNLERKGGGRVNILEGEVWAEKLREDGRVTTSTTKAYDMKETQDGANFYVNDREEVTDLPAVHFLYMREKRIGQFVENLL